MKFLVRLAQAVRRAPGLRRLESLWSLLRPAYFRLIDPFGRGVGVTMAGRSIRLPPAVLSCNPDWSAYERESFAALGAWLDHNSNQPTLLDLGCSFGLVTSFAVQVCPTAEVIAIDSDRVSLRALESLVPAAALPRVRRVEALLGDQPTPIAGLAAAVTATTQRLPALSPRAAISQSCFRCLGQPGSDGIPTYRLDDLLAGMEFRGPVLFKCDVEGAELLVLQGATEFLSRVRPTLLLSVHPRALPDFGQTAGDVAEFLTRHGYRWRVLAQDHEEHWFAEVAS